MKSKALFSQVFSPSTALTSWSQHVILTVFGVITLALLSQVAIHLPWTPVPITGQTFGVLLLAFMFGARLGTTMVMSFLFLSALGLPLLAGGKAFTFGLTSGYLIGMVGAAYLAGLCSDRGWAQTFVSRFLISFFAGLLIILCGAFVLKALLPESSFWWAGVIPFLFGDLVKSLAVAAVMSGLGRLDLDRRGKNASHL